MTVPVETSVIPRGTYTGAPLCRPRGRGRFYQCPICGGWVDGTDMRQVMEHEGIATPLTDMPVAQTS